MNTKQLQHTLNQVRENLKKKKKKRLWTEAFSASHIAQTSAASKHGAGVFQSLSVDGYDDDFPTTKKKREVFLFFISSFLVFGCVCRRKSPSGQHMLDPLKDKKQIQEEETRAILRPGGREMNLFFVFFFLIVFPLLTK